MIEVRVKLNSIELYLLNAYCYGKSALWNLFFGWRKTIFTDGDTPINTAIYKISAKDWKRIKELAREYKVEKEDNNKMTKEEIDEVVKEIREHCRNNHCSTCNAHTDLGCIFISGYPNEWFTTKEAERKDDNK